LALLECEGKAQMAVDSLQQALRRQPTPVIRSMLDAATARGHQHRKALPQEQLIDKRRSMDGLEMKSMTAPFMVQARRLIKVSVLPFAASR